MRDLREPRSDLPFEDRHTSPARPEASGRADSGSSGTPLSAYESNLRFAEEMEATGVPHKQQLGKLIREGSSRIVAEWRATLPAEDYPRDDGHASSVAGQEPEAVRPRASLFEKARGLLGVFGLARSAEPKHPASGSSQSTDAGLYDRATDGGPYDAVKVPPRQNTGELNLTPSHEAQRIAELESALDMARREVSGLRQGVGAVMTNFLIAVGLEPDAARKRATALLT